MIPDDRRQRSEDGALHCPGMPARAPARTRASESALTNALTCAQSLWSQPAAHCSLSPWLVSQVATGSDLQGGGVFSFIKAS